MTRRRLGGLASIMVAPLLLLVARPAAADTIIWQPASCATGEITEYYMDLSGPLVRAVNIAGWIGPCAAAGSTNGFAVMYHTPRANFVVALQPFESLDAPTNFSLRVSAWQLAELAADTGGLSGLCLVRSYEHWLSCVSLEPNPDGTPHMASVAPTHPGLQAPIVTTPPWTPDNRIHAYPDPSCGTCV